MPRPEGATERRFRDTSVPAITTATLRGQIASGSTGPLYVLTGDDDVEKSAVAAEFSGLVEEGLDAFNVDRFHGADLKVDTFFRAVATLPMMAPKRVVLVMGAERFLVPKREGKAADEDQERLEAFVAAPPAHATVVFVCGPLDQRRRLVKQLLAVASLVDCGTIVDAADAARWVKARAAKDGVPLDAGAVRALAERAGPDLIRLRAGLERVALYAMGQAVVTADDVRSAVPAGPEAQEDFGIGKAIWRNDAAAALRELSLALDAGAVPFMLMGQLRAAAERLPAPRVRRAIEAVFEADLALKSSAGEPRILLERLTLELCGPQPARGVRR